MTRADWCTECATLLQWVAGCCVLVGLDAVEVACEQMSRSTTSYQRSMSMTCHGPTGCACSGAAGKRYSHCQAAAQLAHMQANRRSGQNNYLHNQLPAHASAALI